MKNIKYLLLLPLLLLSGCGDKQNNSNSSDSVTTSFTSKWGKELGDVLEKNLHTDLPFIESTSFTYQDSVDDYGDPLTIIYCYFDNDEDLNTAPDRYAALCEADGYDVTLETLGSSENGITYIYDCYFADKIISDVYGIELQFLLGADSLGTDCFGIFAYVYDNYDENQWPETLISEYLGGNSIPSITGDGYTYNFWRLLDDDGVEYLEVVVYGTTFENVDEYCVTLTSNRFLVDNSDYENSGMIAISGDGQIGLIFYFDYDYYNGLVIYIYNLTL